MRIEQILFPAIRAIGERPRLAQFLLGRDRWGNPLSDEAIADPYAFTELAIADGPVVYRRLYHQWFVHGHDEIREVLASPDVGASDQIDTLLQVHPYTRLSDRSRFFLRHFLPVTDPPVHPRLRSLVNRAFTPRRVAELEASVEELAADLLDALPNEGAVDIRRGFTLPLPINVIAELLGVPREHWAEVTAATAEVVPILDPLVSFDPAAVDRAIDTLDHLYGELAEQRRREPTDDLLSGLVAAEDESGGDRLSTDELIAMVMTLMAAGFETTAGLLGSSILHLARNPEQRTFIRSNPDRWDDAVDELLRFDTPITSLIRRTSAPIELGGQSIPAGANLLLSLSHGHRDPTQYDDPYALRLDRDGPRPIAFGHGAHYCLGAALAKMEARIGLRALLDRHPDYEIERVEWRRALNLRNQTELVIRV